MNLDHLLKSEPYDLDKTQKSTFFDEHFHHLTKYHYNHCIEYQKIIDGIGFKVDEKYRYSDIPFLPVRLFKIFDLYSTPKEEIVKTMTSSGTTGQIVSKIFLDKETALNQSKVLTKIVASYLGPKRSPMLIVDSESVLKDRNMFSARGAGILGFSIFGSKRLYALDENMELKTDEVLRFIEENRNLRIFVFGFTFMIFQHFVKELQKQKINIDLSNAVLLHGGGWKKLASESISSRAFRELLFETCNIISVHDYYGMVEQTGSINIECQYGYLHTPIFSDIIIRRAADFSEAEIGETGIVQTLSVIPKSYPGHSLLTEDEGVLIGEDDCECGRLGKYFKILGRLKNAEIRGCSDTYAEKI
jgi:phenylacetate-coenzyme A ligase PaaK-like adenylate-forming protein